MSETKFNFAWPILYIYEIHKSDKWNITFHRYDRRCCMKFGNTCSHGDINPRMPEFAVAYHKPNKNSLFK